MPYASRRPPPNRQEEAANSDLSLMQLVLERSRSFTKTAEDIKQEELLRRSAERRHNFDNLGALPAPAVARPPVTKARNEAPGIVNTTAASNSTNNTEADDLALLKVVAVRCSTASREEAELAKSTNQGYIAVGVGIRPIGTQTLNPGEYVSEKGDTVIAAQTSVDDAARPSMVATDSHAPPDATGDATLKPSSNPAVGNEYDHHTGHPMTEQILSPGSVTPGAYTGTPGADYQAVEPVRLDVLGASSQPSQEAPGQIIEEAEVNTTETVEKKRNPVVVGAAIAVLAVVIILAIAIPLAVGGGMENPLNWRITKNTRHCFPMPQVPRGNPLSAIKNLLNSEPAPG
ncbi:expressed unknown protein [Seminavis robusta]|uniref:Uncharacterized protein n=1 Tax=Seminavis robusta TaxID=568900 RepID=A0A9N8DKE9_9STRA|nr:expressed unknown protein [Seminavis robusta]|eukprot:Sro177_g077660.1 n/a (345) ;mRNA; f:22125-23159